MGRVDVCPPEVTFKDPPPYTTDVPLLPGILRGGPAESLPQWGGALQDWRIAGQSPTWSVLKIDWGLRRNA